MLPHAHLGPVDPSFVETPYDRLLQDYMRDFLPTEWPVRLLHVKSMKSVVREAGNIYDGQIQPRYNILSYTWGRWPNPGGPSLPVSGIDWTIPPVQSQRFSVPQFKRVIQEVGRDVEFVWVDVACIHQEDRVQKAIEIGRQAAIFRNAHQAFIWLNEYSEAELTDYANVSWNNDITFYTMIMHESWTMPNRREDWQKSIHDQLSPINASLGAILSDPWFSSLWTLQESVLRRDALMLSKEGNLVWIKGFGPWKFNLFANKCSRIYETLDLLRRFVNTQPKVQYDRLLEEVSTRHEAATILSAEVEIIDSICQIIEKASLDFSWTENQNKAYSAAQFRTATNRLDRIYGIMQVYGIKCKLLSSQDETSEASLNILEDQFGQNLVGQSPFLSQLFVHRGVFPPRRSWLITQNCFVPTCFWMFQKRVRDHDSSLCQMVVSDDLTYLRFVGKAWHFLPFLKAITLGGAISVSDFQSALEKIFSRKGHQETVDGDREAPPPQPLTLEHLQALPLTEYRRKDFRTGVELKHHALHYGDTVWKVISPWVIRPKTMIMLDEYQALKIFNSSPEFEPALSASSMPELAESSLVLGIRLLKTFGEANVRVLLLGQFHSGSLYSNAALILHAIRSDSGEIDYWERLGIVVWRAEPDWYTLFKGPPVPPMPMWHSFEGVMR